MAIYIPQSEEKYKQSLRRDINHPRFVEITCTQCPVLILSFSQSPYQVQSSLSSEAAANIASDSILKILLYCCLIIIELISICIVIVSTHVPLAKKVCMNICLKTDYFLDIYTRYFFNDQYGNLEK